MYDRDFAGTVIFELLLKICRTWLKFLVADFLVQKGFLIYRTSLSTRLMAQEQITSMTLVHVSMDA